MLLVVVSDVSELLSVRIRPCEPHYARFPVFRDGDRARHHQLAGFGGRRFIGVIIHWLIGQHVEEWASFKWVWLVIESSHPSPVDGLTILIHPVHRALYHVTFGWGIGHRGIFGCATRELRFAFVEVPSAHERIASQSCCGRC